MRVRKLIRLCFVIGLPLLLWACNSKVNQEKSFKLKSVWEYDSISGDSVLFPLNKEFDDIVNVHLASIDYSKTPGFMYNVYLDTSYHRYMVEGSNGRSLRAAIISQINNRDFLELMLDDSVLNKVWVDAKRDSVLLRTNIDMIRDKLISIDRGGS